MSETTNLKLFKHDNPATNTDPFDVDKALNDNWDKVDEFAGETNQKVLSIEEEINTNAENISNIETKNTEQDTEIKALQNKDIETDNKIIELTDKAGNKLKLEIDKTNYIMTLELLNEKGETLDTKTIDFPLESCVINGKYENGNIILTLQSGTEITIPIGDIIDGLISQETFDETVASINEQINNIKSTIETIQSKCQELETENQRLREDIDGIVPPIEGEGENITLNGTSESRFKKFEVSGNSWQETREQGSNSFDSSIFEDITKDGITIKRNDDGTITLNGTYTGEKNWDYRLTPKKIIKNSEELLVMDKISGNITGQFRFMVWEDSHENRWVSLDNTNYRKLLSDRVYTKASLIIYTGATFDNLTIALAISSSGKYEPFVPNKPSPEYPSEIRNCGDNVNLFDYDNVTMNSNTEKIQIEGQQVYKQRMTNSLANQNVWPIFNTNESGLKEGEQYTISFDIWADIETTFNATNIYINSKTSAEMNLTKIITEKQRAEIPFIYKELGTDTHICHIYPKYIEGNEVYVSNLKIEKGTKATPYSKYGEGNVNFSVRTKNLFNVKDTHDVGANTSINDDDFITTTKNNSEGTAIKYENYYTNPSNLIKPNTTYYVICEIQKVSGTGTLNIVSNDSNEGQFTTNKPYSFTNLKAGDIKIFSIQSKEDLSASSIKSMLRTYCVFTSGQSGSITYRISVLEQQPTEENFVYVPHQSQQISFPTKEGQVLHKGDYLADDGVHQIGKTIEFDGTEKWSVQGNEYDTETRLFFSIDETAIIKKNKLNKKAICNYFVYSSNTVQNPAVDITGFNFNPIVHNFIYFKIEKDKLPSPDLAGWKQWLADRKAEGKPLTIEYELEEEQIEPYSPEQQKVYNQIEQTLHSYKDVTHIFSEDEISPSFKVEARADLQTEHDKIYAELNEIKELLSTTGTSAMLVENLEKDLEREVM